MNPCIAPRKHGTMWYRVDFRCLNGATIAETYALPGMKYFMDKLGNTKIFSALDAVWGCCQTPIAEGVRDKMRVMGHVGT